MEVTGGDVSLRIRQVKFEENGRCSIRQISLVNEEIQELVDVIAEAQSGKFIVPKGHRSPRDSELRPHSQESHTTVGCLQPPIAIQGDG
jgi:hypothetical protein